MRLILLDFLARRWWVFLGIAAFAAFGAAVGAIYVFTPWAFLALLLSGQRGWFRTVADLPLSLRSQANAWWAICVSLAALTAALGLLVGALIFQTTSEPQMIPLPDAPKYTLVLNPNHFAPWFAAAVGAWFSLGYAAFNFLICLALPTRLPGTLLQKTTASFMVMLLIFAQSGPMFMSFILPYNPGMMASWHWALFALVPILVVLSWYAAPVMVARRLRAIRGMAIGTAAAASPDPGGGLTGMRLLLARILMLSGFCAAFNALTIVSIVPDFGNLDQDGLWIIVSFLALNSFFLCGLANADQDLRVLRSLPLSTARLAIIRMIEPLATGLCLALVLTVLSRPESSNFQLSLKLLTFFFCFSGGYALIIACQGQFSLWKFLAIELLGAALIIAGFLHTQKAVPFILSAGVVALVISYPLSKRGLRRSETYRKKHGIIETALLQHL